jgi:hypothetical protein
MKEMNVSRKGTDGGKDERLVINSNAEQINTFIKDREGRG